MALIHCESCGSIISSDRSTCSRCGAAKAFSHHSDRRGKWTIILPTLAGVGVLVLVPWQVFAGHRAAASLLAGPLTLEDDTVSVASASSKGVPIQLPYAGDVRLELTVLNGEQLNVHLIGLADWKALTKAQGRTASAGFRFPYMDFQAMGARHVALSGHLADGAYFIVVENPSLGFRDLDASLDVKVRATLKP